MADRPQTPEERAARDSAEVIAFPELKPKALDWERCEERGEPPPRQWAIEHWIGMGYTTLLSGAGGLGKSILVQQALTAIALGKPFIAPVPHPRVCLAWMGEDDEDELWRRQLAISAKFGVGLGALRGRLELFPMEEHECSLLDIAEGRPIRTSNLKFLREQIGDLKAEVVALDNIGVVFGCNENDRHHVSAFFAALRWACRSTGAAVILIGHVAKPKGSEFSGSTAWENKARGRIWLTDRPPDKVVDEEDDQPATDLRYAAKRKVNYTSRDLAVLRYSSGAYDVVQMPAGPGGLVAQIDRSNAQRTVTIAFERLMTMNLQPCEGRSSPHYLPRLIVEYGLAEGFSKQDLAWAMRGLMNDGKLKREVIGKQANRTPKWGLTLHQ